MTVSIENYLKVIYTLKKRISVVRSVDIAREMNVTLPTVNQAMKELIKLGHLTKETDGTVSLTKSGKKQLQKSMRDIIFMTKTE